MTSRRFPWGAPSAAGRRRPSLLITLSAVACLLGSASASAAERITDFACDVTVGDGGMLAITETITVIAEGNQIKRGIYRDIPVRYGGGPFGLGTNIPFTVIEVTRDGSAEDYRTENNDATVRIYIGHADRMLPQGEHTYVIRYETRQLRFFDDHDEVYWNATGNAWAFPIDRATASVRLPEGVTSDDVSAEAYLGPLNSTNQTGVEIQTDGVPPVTRFTASQQLAPGDGLTVVVQFPKGLVTQRSALENVLEDPYVGIGLVGLGVVVGYFVIAWVLVGRDPATGVVIPLFEPPDGLSPAACRFVSRMGFDKDCFSVALLSLGSHGCLSIEEKKGSYTLSRTGSLPEHASRGERKVFEELLGSRREIAVKQTYHSTFSKAIKDLKKSLVSEFEGTLFRPNRVWFFSGVVIAFLALFTTVFLGGGVEASMKAGFLSLWLSFWSIAVVGLVHGVLTAWRAVFTTPGSLAKAVGVGAALFATLFAIPFVGFECFAIFMLAGATSIWMVPIVLGMVATVAVFYELIKAPTAAGRAIMDRIDGFRLYLSTAEQERLEAVTKKAFAGPAPSPEPRTLKLFERFLPYAVALGVANAWADQFQDLIEAASVTEPDGSTHSYHPAWYHGSNWSAATVGAAAAGLGAAMTSAVAAAATSPSSGSGGGGGGSSGGGGGGGGGGGW